MTKITTIILLLFTISSISQSNIQYNGESINALDENGNKVGLWKLYLDFKHILVTIDYSSPSRETNFYKDSILTATYNTKDNLTIYEDPKVTNAKYLKRSDDKQTWATEDGKESDLSIIESFSKAYKIYPFVYGDMNALYTFIKNNFQGKGQKGKVKVKFVLDTNGFTKDIEIIDSTNPALDDEAKRIVKIFPRWQPAFQGTDFIDATLVIPLNIQ